MFDLDVLFNTHRLNALNLPNRAVQSRSSEPIDVPPAPLATSVMGMC
jgi:hypothetical protein